MLALILVPLVTLGVFTFFIVQLIEKDKIAYVYEAAGALANSSADQMSSLIGRASDFTLSTLLLFESSKGQMSPQLEAKFKEQSLASVFLLLKNQGGKPSNPLQLVNYIEKEPGLSSKIFEAIKSQSLWRQEGYHYLKDLGGFLIIQMSGQFRGGLWLEQRKLLGALASPGAFAVGLTQGSELAAVQDGASALFGHLIQSPEAIQVLQRGLAQTSIFTDDQGGRWLGSYAPVVGSNYGFWSVVSYDKVTAVVFEVAESAIYVVILLAAISILVGFTLTHKVTTRLLGLTQATQQIAGGNLDVQLADKAVDEVGILTKSFNRMTDRIKQLLVEAAEKSRMESELQTAQLVQSTFFAEDEVRYGEAQISGFFAPASECGGDWWSHYQHPDGSVWVLVADVTGHGVSAALVTASLAATVNNLKFQCSSPSALVRGVSRSIYELFKGRIMMTLLVAKLDSSQNQVVYANASHEPGYHFTSDKTSFTKLDIKLMDEKSGPRVGEKADFDYQDFIVEYKPKSKFILYTDGVTDLANAEQKKLGERGWVAKVLEAINTQENCGAVKARILASLGEHLKQPPADDVTFVVIERS